MVNQTCSIELCLSVIPFVACGAGVGLTAEVCFLSLDRHLRHLVPELHVERVEAGGFWLAPHNLQPNLMVSVCRASDSFSSDEGWSCRAAAARSVVAQSVARRGVG